MTAIDRMLQLPFVDAAPAALRSTPPRARAAVRIVTLLLLIAVLSAVDLDYTLFAHRIGWLGEMNPVAEIFLSQNLLTSLVSFKLLMVLAGSMMLWRLRNNSWTAAACWILVGVHVALGILWYLWTQEVTRAYELRLAFGF